MPAILHSCRRDLAALGRETGAAELGPKGRTGISGREKCIERPPSSAASAPNWEHVSARSEFLRSRQRSATKATPATPPMLLSLSTCWSRRKKQRPSRRAASDLFGGRSLTGALGRADPS